ncbi:MAG: hypothetical protein DLM63_06690 [Solirubrobacterales bacterium]|nr:MAG: hypothetical protein DLM63_06690 [Solirubrobacterales bacterium]
MSVVVLLAAGFPHDAVVVGITIGGAALAAAVIVPAVELWWCWLQAPMRLLTEDVIAIRERVEQLPDQAPAKPTEKSVNVRLALINQKQVMLAAGAEGAADQIAYTWGRDIATLLTEHGTPSEAERFMTAGTGTNLDRLSARLAVLDELIAERRV